jgi:hypothetical protein
VLSRSAGLFTYTIKNGKEAQWHQTYLVVPEALVVLTNAPGVGLRRRAQTVPALGQADALLRRTPQVAISIVMRCSTSQRFKPAATALPPALAGASFHMELGGLEPPTSWVRCNGLGSLEDADGQQRLF